jgi:dGTPase
MHKTQVFLAPEKDHYRTRLTHTIEVSQISRTVARALRLNEDLAEAIALGHDLGHTPFGHIGEEALTECLLETAERMPHRFPRLPKKFRHNYQSLRVVEFIEWEGKGLNLTYEVKDGILKHTGKEKPETLEGQIVKIADRIAYVNHDIDDALRAKVIKFEELPQEALEIVGRSHGQRIDTMVNDLINASSDLKEIRMSGEVGAALDTLRDFLFQTVYIGSEAKKEDAKAKLVIKELYFYYLNHSEEMPEEYQPDSEEELAVRVCDYVAGMTDRYALKKFEELFLPKPWLI